MPAELLRLAFPRDVHHVAGFHAAVAAGLPRTGRVLDLGCGANADLARYRTATRDVWGTDFARHEHLRFPEWFRPLSADGVAPFPDGFFDVVSANMVLEHVADPPRFLREVARLLRPGGLFVGHTVSGTHYVTLVRRLFGVLPHSASQWVVKHLYGRAEADTFPTFYRMNRAGPLAEACRAAGLSPPVFARYADPGYFHFFRPLKWAAVVLDRALACVSPAAGRLYFTATTRKPG